LKGDSRFQEIVKLGSSGANGAGTRPTYVSPFAVDPGTGGVDLGAKGDAAGAEITF
jgi:hypothetical protein